MNEKALEKILNVFSKEVLPLSEQGVAKGSKIFGAAIIKKDDLSLVVAETNNEIENPLWLLINELILFGCGRWEILDFEGSKEEGLARYYSGFGAQLSPYIRYQRWAIL